MVNYQLGKVYRIVSAQTDRVYIGSTAISLSMRMTKHRANHRAYLAGKFHKLTSFEILQYEDAVIVLVEDCPCDNKEQLYRRERYHIENTANCVNLHIPGRTEAEYYQDNKEVLIEKQKAYYEANREAALEQKKAYYEVNKEALINRMRAYREANKEVMAEKSTCECGTVVSKGSRPRHRKSNKHQAYLAGLNQGAESANVETA